MLVRPQVGQEMTSMPSRRSPRLFKIWMPAFTSSTGSPVSETRMVSPIPLERMAPMPTADFTVPLQSVPASVMPTCSG